MISWPHTPLLKINRILAYLDTGPEGQNLHLPGALSGPVLWDTLSLVLPEEVDTIVGEDIPTTSMVYPCPWLAKAA